MIVLTNMFLDTAGYIVLKINWWLIKKTSYYGYVGVLYVLNKYLFNQKPHNKAIKF